MAQTMPAKSTGAELVSRNPATGEEIGRAPQTMPKTSPEPSDEPETHKGPGPNNPFGSEAA